MDAAAFSTALFAELCDDLGFPGINPDYRFDPTDFVDPFDSDLGYVAKRALLCSLFKKTEVEFDQQAEAVTLLSFLEANNACKDWCPPDVQDLGVGYTLSYARMLLADWFEPQSGTQLVCTMASIEKEARFGPGRSLNLKEKPSLYYFKVGDSQTTATSDFVRSWYDQSVQHNPLCEAAEMARKARHGPALLTDSGNLSMVPKSYSKRRIVMTEASLNTFFQLGLGGVMGGALKKCTGIDFSTQPGKNAMLAKEGSISGAFATVDLKQCSDYIALGLVAYMFPKSVTQWVTKLRTPNVNITGIGIQPLHMASTMGNGFTFPLQSSLLAAIVLGVYKTLDIPINHPMGDELGNYGVFGDDIVLLERAFPLLCKTLTQLGMHVNQDKSFQTGQFRESCGHDYHDGVDVRGVYVKHYTTLQDYFSIYNRLSIWACRHGIALTQTLAFVREQMGDDINVIPPDEGLDGGVILPVAPVETGDGWYYDVYLPVLSSFSVEPWETYDTVGALDKSRKSKQWIRELQTYCAGSFNEPAVLKALLFGGVRRGRLVMRKLNRPKYRKTRRFTPRWGWSDSPLVRDLSPIMIDRWLRSLDLA